MKLPKDEPSLSDCDARRGRSEPRWFDDWWSQEELQPSLFVYKRERIDETASKLNRYEQKTKQFEHNLQEKQTKQEQLKKEIADLQEQKEIRKKSSKKKNNNYILSRINCPMYKIN